VYSKQQKYTQAEECYMLAVKNRPDYLSPYDNLCRILFERKQFKQAEDLCKKGIESIHNSWRLYYLLGKSLNEQDKNKEALKWLNRALELDPGSLEVLELLSSIKRRK
jgi:tetratricopeptide (TPR) repeat protein